VFSLEQQTMCLPHVYINTRNYNDDDEVMMMNIVHVVFLGLYLPALSARSVNASATTTLHRPQLCITLRPIAR